MKLLWCEGWRPGPVSVCPSHLPASMTEWIWEKNLLLPIKQRTISLGPHSLDLQRAPCGVDNLVYGARWSPLGECFSPDGAVTTHQQHLHVSLMQRGTAGGSHGPEALPTLIQKRWQPLKQRYSLYSVAGRSGEYATSWKPLQLLGL